MPASVFASAVPAMAVGAGHYEPSAIGGHRRMDPLAYEAKLCEAGCEILSAPGEIPVKFRDPRSGYGTCTRPDRGNLDEARQFLVLALTPEARERQDRLRRGQTIV